MENDITTIPKMTRMTPVTRFNVFGVALFANTAAILAQSNVKITQRIHTVQSGIPPIAKWDTAPVNAVNVIMKTLVPTAVFNSYPRTEVKISNIIMPPPAPTNPQINPIRTPHTIDWITRFFAETLSIASLVVITGFTINLTPNRNVIKTEKLPMVEDGTRLDT